MDTLVASAIVRTVVARKAFRPALSSCSNDRSLPTPTPTIEPAPSAGLASSNLAKDRATGAVLEDGAVAVQGAPPGTRPAWAGAAGLRVRRLRVVEAMEASLLRLGPPRGRHEGGRSLTASEPVKTMCFAPIHSEAEVMHTARKVEKGREAAAEGRGP